MPHGQMSDVDGSGSEVELDAESEALLKRLPECGRVHRMLQQHMMELPQEVAAALEEMGAKVVASQLLKHSFHATFHVQLRPPLTHNGTEFDEAIAQVVGVDLGDQPASWSVTADILAKAMELGRAAGVRTACVFGTGTCALSGHTRSFIVQELIATETVEDEVMAPGRQWGQIAEGVQELLRELPLDEVDVAPVPRYNTLLEFISALEGRVQKDAALLGSLARFKEHVEDLKIEPEPVQLLNQDINCGNLLCSSDEKGVWHLDGVIDWESAVVADPRFLSSEDPWKSARLFGSVVKGSMLAEWFVNDSMPLCEARELVMNAQQAAVDLQTLGRFEFRTWAEAVAAYEALGRD